MRQQVRGSGTDGNAVRLMRDRIKKKAALFTLGRSKKGPLDAVFGTQVY